MIKVEIDGIDRIKSKSYYDLIFFEITGSVEIYDKKGLSIFSMKAQSVGPVLLDIVDLFHFSSFIDAPRSMKSYLIDADLYFGFKCQGNNLYIDHVGDNRETILINEVVTRDDIDEIFQKFIGLFQRKDIAEICNNSNKCIHPLILIAASASKYNYGDTCMNP